MGDILKNAEYYAYNGDKNYTFKNDEIRKDYENLSNTDRLVTRIFIETVNDWSDKADDILNLEPDDTGLNRILDAIAPSLAAFEEFYPMTVGIKNMCISSTTDSTYQSRLVRKSFDAKGYKGIVILDQLESNQTFKFIMPYGNFFSSSEDIIVDGGQLKGSNLNVGDIILFPKHLTVFYPPKAANKQRFFEFDVAGHE